jgi:hypothetical protein
MYSLTGEHFEHVLDREDLLAVISGMRRYMIDTNAESIAKSEASKPENFDKAFIIGQTLMDERDDLMKLLFDSRTDISNNNLFTFGMNEFSGRRFLTLARLDEYHRSTFDEQKLADESRRSATKTDAKSIARKQARMEDIRSMKDSLVKNLELPSVKNRPAAAIAEQKKASLLRAIRANAPSCLLNYWNSVDVACKCYAVLLLERDDIGDKTRSEFNKAENPNVFGDARVVQNALCLSSHILSRDKGVKRMVEYIGLPEISVMDKIMNPLARVL